MARLMRDEVASENINAHSIVSHDHAKAPTMPISSAPNPTAAQA